MEPTSDQMVDMMIPMADGHGDCGSGDDRRAAPRVGLRTRVAVRMLAGTTGRTQQPRRAWIRNLSADGAGVTCLWSVEVGDSFVLELPRLDGSTVDMLCLVMNCARAADGAYKVGTRFLAPWDEPEARRAATTPPSPSLPTPTARSWSA